MSRVVLIGGHRAGWRGRFLAMALLAKVEHDFLHGSTNTRPVGLMAGKDIAEDRFEGQPIPMDMLAPLEMAGTLTGCHRQQFGRRGKGERKRNRKHRWG